MWGARFFNRALGSNFPRFDVRNQIRGQMPSLPISTSTNFTHACRLDTLKFVDFVLGRHKVSRLSSFCRVFDALDANIRLWIQEIIKWSLPWDFRIWHHLKRKKKESAESAVAGIWRFWRFWRLTSNCVLEIHRRSAPAAFGRGQPGAGRRERDAESGSLIGLRDRYARWRYKSCVETKGMLKCLSKNGKEMERTGIWKIWQQNSRFIVVCRNMREFGSAKYCRKQPWYWHQFLWCNKHSNI